MTDFQLAMISHNVVARKKINHEYKIEKRKLEKETRSRRLKIKINNFKSDILKSLPSFILLVVFYVLVAILNNDAREFKFIVCYDVVIFEKTFDFLNTIADEYYALYMLFSLLTFVSVLGMFASIACFLFKLFCAFVNLFKDSADKELKEQILQLKDNLDTKYGYCCQSFGCIQDAIAYCGCAYKNNEDIWICPFTGKSIGNKKCCKSKNYNFCKRNCSYIRTYYRNVYRDIKM